MFFTSEDFKAHSMSEAQAEYVSKAANDIVDSKGRVMFGRVYEDGTLHNFSSTRTPEDTHIVMGMGFRIIPLPKSLPDYVVDKHGQFQKTEKPLEEPRKVTEADAMKEILRRLEFMEKYLNMKNGAWEYQTQR